MVLKTLALGSLASVTLAAGASAQPAPYAWTGVYGGILVGASVAGNGSRLSSWSPAGDCQPDNSVCFDAGRTGLVPYGSNGSPYLLTTPMTPDTSPTGWPERFRQGAKTAAFGLSLDYKHQIDDHLVIGLEDQIVLFGRPHTTAWASDQTYGPYNVGYSSTSGARSDRVTTTADTRWLNLATAKIGFAQDRSLFYLRGGLAFGEVRMSTSAHSSEAIYNTGYASGASQIDTSWAGKTTKYRQGLAWGGGVEQALTDVLTLRLDATYYNLGSTRVKADGASFTTNTGSAPLPPGAGAAQSYTVTKKIDGLLLSAGLTFRH